MVSEKIEDEDEDNYDTFGSNTEGPHTDAEKSVAEKEPESTDDTSITQLAKSSDDVKKTLPKNKVESNQVDAFTFANINEVQ